MGFPAAYALARIGGSIASLLLSLILTTSLITVVVKLIGLNIILGSDGVINRVVLGLGLSSAPIAMLNNDFGVFIGLVQYTLPLMIVLLFGVVQTIPVVWRKPPPSWVRHVPRPTGRSSFQAPRPGYSRAA